MTTKNVQNIKSYFKGQSIYKEGQKGTVAYMIRKGSVTLYRSVGGKRVVVDKLNRGEIFGEMSVLSKTDRTESAEAAEYTDLMVLTEQLIQSMIERCPKTIQHLTKLLIKRVRKAGDVNPNQSHKNTFLSICRILEMTYRCHVSMAPAEAKRVSNHRMGLGLADFSKQVKNILLVSQLEIDNTLEQLAALKLVTLTTSGSGKAFAERYIKVNDMENFFQVAANLHKELTKSNVLEPELEYIDIHDLADEVDAQTDILYRKLANKEIPETLFFFHKSSILSWAGEQDEDFFKKVKRKKKKVADLEDLSDIVFVDNATLKDAFAKLGYYKLGVLLSAADEEASEKIMGNLSKKIAGIVQDEAKERGPAKQAEVDDVTDELIEMIKISKGVSV